MGKSRIASGRKLVVISGKTKGTAFVLTKPEIGAGREIDNAICLGLSCMETLTEPKERG